MAISKITLNGTTLMDATTATAAAEDITAPKTAMLANGVVTTGTGTGGSGGGGGIDPFPLPDGYSLPSNYQKLLYVDSSSAQICDTGVHPTLETKIEIAGYFIPGTYGTYVTLTGCFNPTIYMSNNNYGGNAKTYFGFGNKSDFFNSAPAPGGIPLYTISKTEGRIQNPPMPDQSGTCGATTMSGSADTTIGIFGRYNGRTVERQSPIRFFRERIWENDVLIRCIFPVLKDGEEVCLYDVINGIYMPNLGTEPLVGGMTL